MRREQGYTLHELMLVSMIVVTVVLSLASVVQHLRASSRTMEQRASVSESRSRVMRVLSYELRNAHRVETAANGSIRLVSAERSVVLSVRDAWLQVSEDRLRRVPGVRALRVQGVSGALVTLRVQWSDGTTSDVTSKLRGGSA